MRTTGPFDLLRVVIRSWVRTCGGDASTWCTHGGSLVPIRRGAAVTRPARVFPMAARRVPGGPTTPGMHRTEALAEDGVWLGTVETEPGVLSGWHHHGDYDTYIYVLRGQGRVDTWTDGQMEQQAAGPGDVVHVPAHTVHREGSANQLGVEAVLVRIGSGQVVFNVHDVPDDS